MDTVWFRRRGPVWLAALLLGPAVAGLLTPDRGSRDGTHVALVLVLVVAAVASAGRPPAGLVAAVTTGLAYDFFWTAPYDSLRVLRATDVETVVLLVLVGAAVEQLSWWGGRQRTDAHFAVVASTQVARPSREQRQVAALLGRLSAGLVAGSRPGA